MEAGSPPAPDDRFDFGPHEFGGQVGEELRGGVVFLVVGCVALDEVGVSIEHEEETPQVFGGDVGHHQIGGGC